MTESVQNVKGRGRKCALNESEVRYLQLNSTRDRRKTLTELTAEFNLSRKTHEKVGRSTVARALSLAGLRGRVAAKKPLLRPINVRKRLAFARAHVDWPLEKWHQVLWTDETKVEFFGCKRRVFVRRRVGERFKSFCLVPTMKHGGGSLMVWAAISAHGVAPLKRIVGIMDKKVYHSILVRHALPAGKRLIGKPFILQQDNDPKHTSRFCQDYLARKEKSGNEE